MPIAVGASSGWTIGLILGVVVVIVAAAIVITIVALAMRIAKQASGAVEGVEVVRYPDRRPERHRPDQRLGRADPALGPGAAQGGGGQMTLFALTNHGAWGIGLIIALVAALAVAGLLAVLIRTVQDIDKSATALLEVAGKVAGNTANIPQLQATAPVLSQIVDEAIIQDGYMNALTDGYGGVPALSSTDPDHPQRVLRAS